MEQLSDTEKVGGSNPPRTTMEYKSDFTIEDFEELLRELKSSNQIIGRMWPRTQQEDDLLKEAIRKYLES